MMKSKIDYQGALKWTGILFLTWVIERLLDNLGLFEKILSVFKVSKSNKVISFLSKTVSFSYLELLIIFLLFIISYFLINFLLKIFKNNSRDKRKEKFKKRFKYMSIPENDAVIFKTEIEFDNETNEVFLSSIFIYCNEHDIKYRLVLQSNNELYECPKSSCKTGFIKQFLLSKVKPLLQAELEHEWNKI